MSKYPNLLSPFPVGKIELRNRIVSCAHVTHFAQDGADSKRDLDYQLAKANGGAGLLITGNRLVHPTSTIGIPRFSWSYLRDPAGDRRIADAVHNAGAAIFVQLVHFGLNGSSEWVNDSRVLWAPSAVRSPTSGEIPKEMEAADIHELPGWWGRAAATIQEGGFDGVELHLAHGHLLHQFLSPLFNKRSDEYGGSFENRLRLSLDVLGAVRAAVGNDFVVGIRINLTEYMKGGLDAADAIETARALEQTGQVDYLNVTGGGAHTLHWAPAPSDVPDGWLLDHVGKVKSAVPNMPLIAVGGLGDPVLAERVLAEGTADLVAMTRAQIADPELVKKLQEGREGEIYRCIRCNQACIGRLYRGMPVGCTINPRTGREGKFDDLTPASNPGRWLVVGGGPAGMKAAETLARRGHSVTLIEREKALGGQVNLIARTPGRKTFELLVRDLEAQLERLDVDVQLAREGTHELVHELAPDGVLVATGAIPDPSGYSSVLPLVERLPGCEQENVLSVWDVALGRRPAGQRVVVLDDDGGRYTAGVAELLLDAGSQVTVVTPGSSLFPQTAMTLEQPVLYERLFNKGLDYRCHTWATGLIGRELMLRQLYTGAESTQTIDTLVLATARMVDDTLYRSLHTTFPNVHRIGDCVAPRKLDHAIYEGYVAGRELFGMDERYINEGELERWS